MSAFRTPVRHACRLLAATLLGACAAAASATTVYENDFDAPASVLSGVGASWVAGGGVTAATTGSYAATYGQIFRNETTGLTELTLTGLPAHTAVDLDFVAAFLDSWDSTNGSPAPDYLQLYVDGNLVAQYTARNASGNVLDIGGGSLIGEQIQFDDRFFYSDTAADMSGDPGLVFAHAASTLTIGWQAGGAGWQGGTDESWGIDDVRVSVTPVPEPSALALMLAGLAATLRIARRRR